MSRFYNHLSRDERRMIYNWRLKKVSVNEMAMHLGRHRSTIFREIKRNSYFDEDDHKNNNYYHMCAEEFYRRRRQKRAKFECVDGLKKYVAQQIKNYWSPEQIAGFLKNHDDSHLYACHETIYRFVYSAEGKKLGLYKYLFRARKHRNKRFARRPRENRGIPESMFIKNRPTLIADRQEIGHWEGDLMIFERQFGNTNITTLTERKTRYTILIKNSSKHSKLVMGQIRQRLSELPKSYRRSVTFDRGSEFVFHHLLSHQLSIQSFYCNPQAPWQKGTVENTNGRIRRFLPRSTDLDAITEYQLQMVANKINNTPRKCLDYRTPEQVFNESIAYA